jgi:hypothetical protein
MRMKTQLHEEGKRKGEGMVKRCYFLRGRLFGVKGVESEVFFCCLRFSVS